jgi:hypothetical protein
MSFLQMKLAVEETPPDSEIQSPLRTSCGVGAKTWAGLVATVFPEFIARDERRPWTGAVKEESAGGGAARRR